MKKWKVWLIIGMMILALMSLVACDAVYRPDDSNFGFGTDGSIFYYPEESNWSIKLW